MLQKKGDLEDIAKVYDLPAENLISEIKKYNEAANSGNPCEFGKAPTDVKF